MKKLFSITLIIAFFIFGLQNLYGQKKDTTGQSQKKDSINKNNDSLNTIILQKFNKKQQEIEKLRIADSITKSNLEKEINSLKTTDNLKKQDLEKQLQEIRNKEALRFAEKRNKLTHCGLPQKGILYWDFLMIHFFIFITSLVVFQQKKEPVLSMKE